MKKRIITFIIAVILLPLIVHADMGAPMLTPYDIIVTNPNGAVVIDNEGKEKIVPYDTVIKDVVFEITENGVLYLETNEGKIKSSDCRIYSKDVNFESMNNIPGKLYVYKEGAYLYKGPSQKYGKVDNEIMVPVGETLSYTYSDDFFSYVTYKGVSGWVYSYHRDFDTEYLNELSSVCTVRSGTMYTINDTELYSLPYGGEKIGKVIPKGTEFNYDYIFNISFGGSYYVKYDGVYGWITLTENTDNKYDIARVVKDGKIYNYDKIVKVCKNVTDKCNDVVGEIPINTFVKVKLAIEFHSNNWYYIEYNNIKGWVYWDIYNENSSIYLTNTNDYNAPYSYDLKEDLKIYDKVNGTETGNTIEPGIVKVDVTIYDENYNKNKIQWLHIVDKGWIKVGENSGESLPDEPQEPEVVEPPQPTPVGVPSVNSMSTYELISYIVIGTILLSVSIVVLIKLINKDKNREKEIK